MFTVIEYFSKVFNKYISPDKILCMYSQLYNLRFVSVLVRKNLDIVIK